MFGLSPGAVDVEVVNAGGTGSLVGVADFTYVRPAILSIAVNDGPAATLNSGMMRTLAGQSSVVKQILVTFNQPVRVAADAFNVTRRSANVNVSGGASPSTLAVAASAAMIDPTQALVTFWGAGTHGGGVIDSGVYDLTTLASKVTVGSQTMAANHTTPFFALFGNIEAYNRYNGVAITQPIPQAGYSSGNGLTKAFVDPGSLFRFSDTFGSNVTNPVGPPAYDIVFDYNLDGAIDPGDLFAFSDSFGNDWVF